MIEALLNSPPRSANLFSCDYFFSGTSVTLM
jgi:hypothetical protein